MAIVKLGPVSFVSNRPSIIATAPGAQQTNGKPLSWDQAKSDARIRLKVPSFIPGGFALRSLDGFGAVNVPSLGYPVEVVALYSEPNGGWLRIQQYEVQGGNTGLQSVSVQDNIRPVTLTRGPAVTWTWTGSVRGSSKAQIPAATANALAWYDDNVFVILSSTAAGLPDLIKVAEGMS